MAFGFWLRKPLAACVLLAAVPALAQEPAYDDGGAGNYAGAAYAPEGAGPPSGGMLDYGGMQGYAAGPSMGPPSYDAYGIAQPGCAQGCMPGCEAPDYPAALPVWFGRADWLYWTRDNQVNNSGVLSVNDNGTFTTADDTPVLTTSDLNFGYQSGYRVEVGRMNPAGLSIWGGYFAIEDWNQFATATDLSGDPINHLSVPGVSPSNLLLDDFVQAFQQTATYNSLLRSGEINVGIGHQHGCFNHCPAIGFRWLKIKESFEFTSIDDQFANSDVGSFESATDNNLYGLQYSDSIYFCHDRWNVNVFGKAGVYGNTFQGSTTLVNNSPPPIGTLVFQSGASDFDVAYVAEGGVNFLYYITPNFVFRTGYSLMWVDQLALATNQTAITTAPLIGPDNSGAILYHGANLGLEVRY